ncbi:hypothetical protein RRG08_013733 [Elysia crispata]|uniref:Uncharacterized protein n=1 Tax=Elysia crispata TaxID=231223 RepID=A0AAE1DJP9_9GAST|nr:hypothetical protein RRG08_013733 [Elysia crispata]
MDGVNKLYHDFFKAFTEVHSTTSGTEVQRRANEKWAQLKAQVKYFPSIAAKNRHQAAHSAAEVVPVQEDQDEDEESLGIDASEEEDAPAPIYRNIFEIMCGPFVLDE